MQSGSILFAKLASAAIAVDIIFPAAEVQMRNKPSWERGGGGPGLSEAATNGGDVGEEGRQHLPARLQPCLKCWD